MNVLTAAAYAHDAYKLLNAPGFTAGLVAAVLVLAAAAAVTSWRRPAPVHADTVPIRLYDADTMDLTPVRDGAR